MTETLQQWEGEELGMDSPRHCQGERYVEDIVKAPQ